MKTEPEYKLGDRVLFTKKHAGTIVDVVQGYSRWYYTVALDDHELARTPPQTAGAVRESDLEKIA